jgi:hypothetical protein
MFETVIPVETTDRYAIHQKLDRLLKLPDSGQVRNWIWDLDPIGMKVTLRSPTEKCGLVWRQVSVPDAGTKVRFRSSIAPRVGSYRGTKKIKIPIRDDSKLIVWFGDRCAERGILIKDVTAIRLHTQIRGKASRNVEYGFFQGEAVIADPTKTKEVMMTGLGDNKFLGFGLMHISKDDNRG